MLQLCYHSSRCSLASCVNLPPSAGALPSPVCLLQVYECLKRFPWNLVEGDFVRAEARTGASDRRPLKKTDAVADGTVLRVFTNRKSHWQHKC